MVNLLMKKILLKILITKTIWDYITFIQDPVLVFFLDRIKLQKIFWCKESLSLAKHNKIFKTVTVKKFYLLAFLFFFLSISSSQAQSDSPIYINPSYIQIQQSGTAVAAVTGIDLNNAVIKINGSGIFGFISEQNPDGTQLQVQFSAQPTAELGEREFFIKTETQEAKFIIKVIPSGAPTVESIYPNSAKEHTS